MAKYTGKDGKVTTDTDAVVNLKGFTLEENAEELDASIIDGGNNYSCEGGQESWSGTVEVLFDPLDAGIANLLPGAKVALVLYPTGDVAGITKTGSALVTGVSTPIETNGMIAQSITYKGDGALVTATIP